MRIRIKVSSKPEKSTDFKLERMYAVTATRNVTGDNHKERA